MIDFSKLWQQMQSAKEQMADMKAEQAKKEYRAKSGGGLVDITLDGKGVIKSLNIDHSLLAPTEKNILEDLIKAAYNDAKSKLDADTEESLAAMMTSLGLPPGFKIPF